MRFTKMEGLGNDYIYLNCLEEEPENLPELARRLSRRRFGVGADGIICVKPGRGGDFAMEMYNADGSRGTMCGNGIRCVGKYVYDKGLTRKTCLTIDTGAGPRSPLVLVKHCWPKPLQGRRMYRFSAFPALTSWKCLWV